MKIKVTPFTSQHAHLEGEYKFGNFYYLAEFHSAGIVTEIEEGDDWLESETSWVSRSELPLVTAIRLAQLQSSRHLVEGCLTPIIKKHNCFYIIKDVEAFPSEDECRQLIYKYSGYALNGGIRFYKRNLPVDVVAKIMDGLDVNKDLLARAASCLYKAHLLLNTSTVFAEEIYTVCYIALEAIIEHVKITQGISKEEAIMAIGALVVKKEPGIDLKEYEEEIREGIRNNIIHPFRSSSGEMNAQPTLMAEYVYDELGFIDWLFGELLIDKKLI
jgi:hypothetical protein